MTEENLKETISISNKYTTRKKVIDFAKIGEKLSLTGSNCHYCKCIMTVQESNACRNTDRTNLKKKTCNKKFCYDCLEKNFQAFWNIRNNKDWKCPCCCLECSCSQCKKNWKAKIKSNHDLLSINEKVKNYDDKHLQESYLDTNEVAMQLLNSNNYNEKALNENKNNENKFSLKNVYSILGLNQNALDKFSTYINKSKNEALSEKIFMPYEKAKDKYLETIEKYKDKITPINMFILSKKN